LIELVIDEDGHALFPKTLTSADPRLTASIYEVVPEWRFTSPRFQGRAVSTTVRVPIEFASLADRTFDENDVDVLPKPVRLTRPRYPRTMLSHQRMGQIVVDFIVDEMGRVDRVEPVLKSLPDFEGEVRRAMTEWRFEPGLRDGKAVRTRMRVPFSFVIGE
jgi:TonB family protein